MSGRGGTEGGRARGSGRGKREALDVWQGCDRRVIPPWEPDPTRENAGGDSKAGLAVLGCAASGKGNDRHGELSTLYLTSLKSTLTESSVLEVDAVTILILHERKLIFRDGFPRSYEEPVGAEFKFGAQKPSKSFSLSFWLLCESASNRYCVAC